MSYGPNGWFEKIHLLQYRTEWLCNQLEMKGITFFRQPYSNQVTIESKFISNSIAAKYGLVPDSHNSKPNWYKIVVMEHVTVDVMVPFVEELEGI